MSRSNLTKLSTRSSPVEIIWVLMLRLCLSLFENSEDNKKREGPPCGLVQPVMLIMEHVFTGNIES